MGGKAFCGYWLQFAPVNVHQPIFEHQSSPEFQTKSSRSSRRHPCDLKWSVAATCLQTLDLDMLAYEDEDTSTESPYDWSPLPKKKKRSQNLFTMPQIPDYWIRVDPSFHGRVWGFVFTVSNVIQMDHNYTVEPSSMGMLQRF